MKKQTINLLMYCLLTISISACGGKSQENNTSSTSTESKKTEWTEWLDQYESVVEKNNALQARIKSGDMDAMNDAANISKEMIDLSSKLQAGQSSMSASESKRLIDIMQKIEY
jgi:hypothetical protein